MDEYRFTMIYELLKDARKLATADEAREGAQVASLITFIMATMKDNEQARTKAHARPRMPNNVEMAAISGPLERQSERSKPTMLVTGQVLEHEPGRVKLYLCGIDDEYDTEEAWVSTPMELPHWALSGDVWTADISGDVDNFSQLSERTWALRDFEPTPRPYLSISDLRVRLIKTL